MTKLVLPDELVELLRQYSGAEDNAKMQTARLFAEFWQETGGAVAHYLGESMKSAHKIFIECACAHVGMSPSSGYNRSRVGRNICMRGLEQENLSFGHYLALLRNIKSEGGLADLETLQKRLDWLNRQTDKFGGQVPSVRDIDREYRKNGHLTEEAIHWNAIVRNAKKIEKHEDARVMAIVIEIIRLDKEIKGKE